MYQIFANGSLLYDTTINSDEEMQILNPTLSMTYGEAGSLIFTFPVTHKLWGTSWNGHSFLCGRNDFVIVLKDGKWLWEGNPTNYEKDIFGDYSVTCSGALDYLQDVIMPLRPIITAYNGQSTQSVIAEIVRVVLAYYNDRITELNSRFGLGNHGILHKRIYPGSILVNASRMVSEFVRVSNFETCFDVLKSTIIDSFGGAFFITKNASNGNLELNYSDSALTGRYNGTSKGIIKLGGNLMDYNISEEFTLCTSVIPLGDEYQEKGSDGARWWFKNNDPIYFDMTQRATISGLNHGDGTVGTYGSRIYLGKDSSENADLVRKYGFHEVILDLQDVAAKFPGNAGSSVGGWEYYYAQYGVTEWRSLDDYLGNSGKWAVYETVSDDHSYKSDYQKALLIYGRDYLENQQFNKLILEITASDIDPEEIYDLDLSFSLGYIANVSADLFGRNIKQYIITNVNIPLDSPSDLTIIMGGEETKLTNMVRYK